MKAEMNFDGISAEVAIYSDEGVFLGRFEPGQVAVPLGQDRPTAERLLCEAIVKKLNGEGDAQTAKQ